MVNEKFNEETCSRCGICFEQCPFSQLPREQAKEEISTMIDARRIKKTSKTCASCSYCNIVCPTHSNPHELRREINLKAYEVRGATGIALTTEEMPYNLVSVGLEINPKEKKQYMEKFTNPPKNDEMFFLGCSIPYYFPELTETKLLEGLPMMGGMKYCCNAYVDDYFGENETRIKGVELHDKLKTLGVRKLISFCPSCENMLKNVYPSIIDGYDIKSQNIIEYLIEKYHEGELIIKNKINQRITFQDPCPWRSLDRKIYDGPRELLEIMGAEVVEMKHNRENSLCCSSPLVISNSSLGRKMAKKRIMEAKDVDADAIAFICTGCLIYLAKPASRKGIDSYYITELAQMAIGEKPAHQLVKTSNQIEGLIFKKIGENPELLERYTMKNGKIEKL